MREIRLLRRDRVSNSGEKGKYILTPEHIEGLIFALNALIYIALGATILRISDVAELYRQRIGIVAPAYVDYIWLGKIVGYALLFFAFMQVFIAAMKFYAAKELKRVRVVVEKVEKVDGGGGDAV
ncbi:hypothetical protein DRO97_01990 [Archaeoglobales archaeon]|nr:MAG: hypothetical protein DRO97_01990 [Archaeoglobales archaeon]